jgi:N6-adenine-specific methylase
MARENASFIKTEAQRLGLANVVMVRDNVFDFLPICREKFDIIFADPPYALEGLETLPDQVFAQDLLHPGCYFILEHGGEHSFKDHPRFKKEKVYGRVHFTFFEQAE